MTLSMEMLSLGLGMVTAFLAGAAVIARALSSLERRLTQIEGQLSHIEELRAQAELARQKYEERFATQTSVDLLDLRVRKLEEKA